MAEAVADEPLEPAALRRWGLSQAAGTWRLEFGRGHEVAAPGRTRERDGTPSVCDESDGPAPTGAEAARSGCRYSLEVAPRFLDQHPTDLLLGERRQCGLLRVTNLSTRPPGAYAPWIQCCQGGT